MFFLETTNLDFFRKEKKDSSECSELCSFHIIARSNHCGQQHRYLLVCNKTGGTEKELTEKQLQANQAAHKVVKVHVEVMAVAGYDYLIQRVVEKPADMQRVINSHLDVLVNASLHEEMHFVKLL